MSNNKLAVVKTNEQQQPDMEKSISKGFKGELKRIPVSDIEPDPNQPRKTFYKESMEDLERSIAAVGEVLESLLLRKIGDGKYRIIFGERRWRAAKKLELHDIPAMIIEASNDQVLSLQLIENLQRENLQPMEQAAGFRKLADECHMNTREIAIEVGKSEYFVRQQIKLTSLIPQWQNIVSKHGISLSIALQIAVLPETLQKDIYSNNVTKDDEKSDHPTIRLNQHTLNQYKGLLSEAIFDLNDPTLDKKMGACTNCPFNSACHSLFPDEQKNPRCNNISCFNNKTVIHQNQEFNKAKDDPTVMLVYDGYSASDDVKKLKGQGMEVLKLGYSDDCKELVEPRKPTLEEYETAGKRNKLSKKEIQENFKKASETYDFTRKTFDKHIASGKYKKAFVVYDSSDRKTGRYIWVELNPKKNTAKETKKSIASGNASIQDIDNEISRLRDREIRSTVLDDEKVQEKIVANLKENKQFLAAPKTTNRIDNLLIRFWLLESIGYSKQSIVEKVIKQPASNLSQYLKWLESLSNQQVSFLIRQIVLDKYGTHLPKNKGGFMLRKMAESLNLFSVTEIEKEQKAKAQKRKQNVQARIDELNKLKKQYNATVKTTTAGKQAADKKVTASKAA